MSRCMRELFSNGKGILSTKRVFGSLGFCIFLSMAVLSGFECYNMNENIILGGLGICSGLMGFTAFESSVNYKKTPLK